MDTIRNKVARSSLVVGLVGALMLVGAGAANATTDPVETAFNDMEAKVTTYGAAIVALVVLAVAIFLGIKYLKRGVSKA